MNEKRSAKEIPQQWCGGPVEQWTLLRGICCRRSRKSISLRPGQSSPSNQRNTGQMARKSGKILLTGWGTDNCARIPDFWGDVGCGGPAGNWTRDSRVSSAR